MGMSVRVWQCVAGFSGFIALSMGAIAAHAFTMFNLMALVEKGSLYQMIHTLAILWLIGREGCFNMAARWLFLLGIVLFSGSLYLKAFYYYADISYSTPAGGICLMLGWAALAMGPRFGKKPAGA